MAASRLFGFTAIVVGGSMAIWPHAYQNPACRVLFHYVTARQAGLAWLAVGVCAAFVVANWTTALLGSAFIGWGLGLGAAALTTAPERPKVGSPLGWLWFVAFGLATLRTLVVLGPDRMRT